MNFSVKFLVLFISTISALYAQKQGKEPLGFPKVGAPVQITSGGKEHFFASYYGINSWSKNQRYVTVLQTAIRDRLPEETDEAVLGMVDLRNNQFMPLTTTRAWNFQEGCMSHWLGSSPDSLIIFNDFRNGKFISVIFNVHTKKEVKIIDRPISAVSPNGKEAVGLNFARLRKTRVDYGYAGNGQDAQENTPFPENDGIFLIDLQTGKSKLLMSIKGIKDQVPELKEGAIEYFAHILYSRNGSKLSWLARGFPDRNTTVFTINGDGTGLQRSFPDNWEGSHYDWLNDNELMVTANYDGKQYAHVLYTIGKKNYKRLGNGILDYDGHGTFSPDQKWMVTDTYPSPGMREQKIYLMNMATEAVLPLGRYPVAEGFKGFWRCDIHCRWSPKGDMIGFNSTHSGSRQVYIFKLSK